MTVTSIQLRTEGFTETPDHLLQPPDAPDSGLQKPVAAGDSYALANQTPSWWQARRLVPPSLEPLVARYENDQGALPQDFLEDIKNTTLSHTERSLRLALVMQNQVIQLFNPDLPMPLPLLVGGHILGRGSSATVLDGQIMTKSGNNPAAIRISPSQETTVNLSLLRQLDQNGIGHVRFFGTTTIGGEFILATNLACGKLVSRLEVDLAHLNDHEKEDVFLQIMSDIAKMTRLGLFPFDPQFILGPNLEVQWIDFDMWRQLPPRDTAEQWKFSYEKRLEHLGLHPRHWLAPQEAMERQARKEAAIKQDSHQTVALAKPGMAADPQVASSKASQHAFVVQKTKPTLLRQYFGPLFMKPVRVIPLRLAVTTHSL